MKQEYQLESSLSSRQPEDDSTLQLKDEISSTCRFVATDCEQCNKLIRLRENDYILVFRGRWTGEVGSPSMA
jgi:hypothetical protein